MKIKRRWFKTKESGDIEENFEFNKTKDVSLPISPPFLKRFYLKFE